MIITCLHTQKEILIKRSFSQVFHKTKTRKTSCKSCELPSKSYYGISRLRQPNHHQKRRRMLRWRRQRNLDMLTHMLSTDPLNVRHQIECSNVITQLRHLFFFIYIAFSFEYFLKSFFSSFQLLQEFLILTQWWKLIHYPASLHLTLRTLCLSPSQLLKVACCLLCSQKLSSTLARYAEAHYKHWTFSSLNHHLRLFLKYFFLFCSQQQEVILQNNQRAGFLIGDGAGVGKGRTVAGIILENYLKGRKKALW